MDYITWYNNLCTIKVNGSRQKPPETHYKPIYGLITVKSVFNNLLKISSDFKKIAVLDETKLNLEITRE